MKITVKRTLTLGAAIAVAALGGGAIPATAQSGYYIYEINYFSDSTLTKVVGMRVQHCNGPDSVFGTTSSHQTATRTGWCARGGGGGEW